MTDLRKAAESACDGWENDDVIGEMDGLMKALRQALAQPEWVGLTDEDWNRNKHSYDFQKGVDWAEAILKEKNT